MSEELRGGKKLMNLITLFPSILFHSLSELVYLSVQFLGKCMITIAASFFPHPQQYAYLVQCSAMPTFHEYY
jgi:hypothetical protein